MIEISNSKRDEVVRILRSFIDGGGGDSVRANRARMARKMIAYLEQRELRRKRAEFDEYADFT